MKTLSKIKKDFGAGPMYVPCECYCTCGYPDGNFSGNSAENTHSANYKYAN